MSETVTRIRLVDTGEQDRYGKPKFSEIRTTHIAKGFAPQVSTEANGVEETFTTDGGSLYFRAPNFCDAEPDDRFVVRGIEYDVTGTDSDWRHPSSGAKGNVIVLKRSEVAND